MFKESTKKEKVTGHAKSPPGGVKKHEHLQKQQDNHEETTSAGHECHDTRREGRSIPSRQRRPVATSTSLFVTGVAHSINKSHIERLFSKFGTVDRVSEFMTSKRSTSNPRYCFVEYDSIENAQKAMDNLNGKTLLRKRLVVLSAHAKTDDNLSSTRKTVSLNPEKERIILDQKIASLKKKIKESYTD
mmetsp:Transcript_10633/g.25592  ORF Transcript_10633/g.25592 Transcript_10633/m.25592 type:complete len:188 (-) Transcript_10633:335-898(-)